MSSVEKDDPEAGFAWAVSISDESARNEKVKNVINNWKVTDKAAALEAVISAGYSEQVTEDLLGQLE